ncbi:outer membrane beta-barrel protein [Desulfuromonas carbonis]|uniref:outer membrane protein n=1 Tax=Desulfuromonas sp. DDH964 TaxID=1823759 RepID=UPI00078B6657|nr:outer membrane beta-barrel protein [Desulfuromonas sp. DDH964]AMV72481.1 outer membrane channel protein [Desulfuromonas sp. DDH964]
MKQLRQFLMALALVGLLCTTAAAEVHDGLYAGLYGGLPVLEDATAQDALGSYNLETDPGSLYALTLGYELPPGSPVGDGRLELDVARRSNDYSQATFSDTAVSAEGTVSADSLLLNSFAAFRNRSPVTPYLGVGAGVAQLTVDNLVVDGVPLIDDDTLVFAWQAGCGLDIDLTRWLRLDVGYRYFATQNTKFNNTSGNKVKLEYTAHTALVGVVVKF